MSQFDCAIVGGGVSGLTAAIALTGLGYRVAVIERTDYGRKRIGEILAPEAKIPLMALGLWNEFRTSAYGQPVARLSAWGSERVDVADYMFNAFGSGWLIARPKFERMLADAASNRGVTLMRDAHVERCARDRSGWRFTLSRRKNNKEIGSRFAVAATGRASSALRGLRQPRMKADQLVGIVSRIMRPANWSVNDNRPLIEAVAEGWWYSVLFPDGHVHVALMTDSDLARDCVRKYGSRSDAIVSMVARAPRTRERLGTALDFSAPPTTVAADTYFGGRIADDALLAVGDTAMALDPLSGQGSFASLEGGIRAAEAIDAFLSKGEGLQEYADRERRRFAQALI